MSKKVNWAEVDKRIRNRRKDFSADEMKTIEAGLQKLPDLAESVDVVTIPQPAIAGPDGDADGDADPGEALN